MERALSIVDQALAAADESVPPPCDGNGIPVS